MNARGQYGEFGRSFFGRATRIGLSPEALKEDLERLNGEIRSLQERISAQRVEMVTQAPGQLRQSPLEIFFQKRWTPFYSNWRHYYDQLRGMEIMGWLGMAKIIEKALGDWQHKLIDMRVDAGLAGLRTNGASAPVLPTPPASPPGFTAPPPPGPTPTRPADQAVPVDKDDKDKDSNVGLYVALGIGAVVMAAAALSFHAGSA